MTIATEHGLHGCRLITAVSLQCQLSLTPLLQNMAVAYTDSDTPLLSLRKMACLKSPFAFTGFYSPRTITGAEAATNVLGNTGVGFSFHSTLRLIGNPLKVSRTKSPSSISVPAWLASTSSAATEHNVHHTHLAAVAQERLRHFSLLPSSQRHAGNLKHCYRACLQTSVHKNCDW